MLGCDGSWPGPGGAGQRLRGPGRRRPPCCSMPGPGPSPTCSAGGSGRDRGRDRDPRAPGPLDRSRVVLRPGPGTARAGVDFVRPPGHAADGVRPAGPAPLVALRRGTVAGLVELAPSMVLTDRHDRGPLRGHGPRSAHPGRGPRLTTGRRWPIRLTRGRAGRSRSWGRASGPSCARPPTPRSPRARWRI